MVLFRSTRGEACREASWCLEKARHPSEGCGLAPRPCPLQGTVVSARMHAGFLRCGRDRGVGGTVSWGGDALLLSQPCATRRVGSVGRRTCGVRSPAGSGSTFWKGGGCSHRSGFRRAERCPRPSFAERGRFARQQSLSPEHPCTCVVLTRLVPEFAVAVDFLI